MRWCWLLTLSACGVFGPRPDPEFVQHAEVTPPWAAYDLPLGRVTYSGPAMLVSRHAGGKPTQAYVDALAAAGFERTAEGLHDGHRLDTWSRGSDQLTLAVMRQGGENVVTLAVVPP